MNFSSLLISLGPLAWLLPNHYPPWVSAWHEGVALSSAVAALLLTGVVTRQAKHWTALIMAGLASICVQYLSGRIFFGGDAVMAAVYLAGLAAAISVGGTLIWCSSHDESLHCPLQGIEFYALSVLLAATASVGIALLQWTNAASLGMWQVDMPAGGRPYGNVAQPNHLCTICALGLVSAGLLRQTGRVGAVGFWVVSLWMLWGMAATGSRTGWLQIATLAGLTIAFSTRAGLRLGPGGAVALIAQFASAVLAWPLLGGLMRLQEGRALDEFAQPGTRWLHWTALTDAVTREPLWGYGWQQISVAQVRGAELHPYVGEHIEYSHNLLLDLVLWAGLPVGLAMAGLAAYWFVSRLGACRDGVSAWLLIGISMLTVHATLEYPLSYAYFLVPLGVMIGAVDAVQTPGQDLRFSVLSQRLGAAGMLLLLGWIGLEYLKAEQGHRLLRLESARIGTTGLKTPPPELKLLTQLGAFQRFAHTQPVRGMSAEQVDQMRRVSERFAYPPSMYRYALAAGLNGRPDVAAMTLLRLCRIHPAPRCHEARDAWAEAQKKFTELRDIAPPTLP